jgi:hypothetical protein
MLKNRIVWSGFILAFALSHRSACAQSASANGLYEIISGRYSECCGIAGNDFGYDLPDESQKYARFTVDAQRHVTALTFLAGDARTVFSTIPCPPSGAIEFSFEHGLVFPDRTIFHVDPGPPPYQMYWNYTVSNSPNRLRIDGQLGTARAACLDVPTRFGHSDVVAVLLPGPRLQILNGPKKEAGTRMMVQGRSGWTDVIEASTDLVAWTPVSTNFMDFSLCPICPFAIFEDAASTNLARRFYRAVEYP